MRARSPEAAASHPSGQDLFCFIVQSRLSPGAAPGPFLVRVDPQSNDLDTGLLFDGFPHADRGRTLCTRSPGNSVSPT